MNSILTIKNLEYAFTVRRRQIYALQGVDLKVERGECLVLAGESGAGKSVLAGCLLGINAENGKVTGGTILYDDGTEPAIELTALNTQRDWLRIRGRKIAMVTQDPMTGLDPLRTVGYQIGEALKLHSELRGRAIKKRVCELLEEVGITEPEKRFRQYPHEFSGGMRQRAVIAMALACSPKVLVCDEPTTSLDTVIQTQILKVLIQLKEKYGLTILFITHDLQAARSIADRVAVMHEGRIIETGACREILEHPKEPFTAYLVQSAAAVRGSSVTVSEEETKRTENISNIPEGALRSEKTFQGETGKAKILELDHVTVSYGRSRGGVPVIKDLSLDLYEQEITGLVGESGAGKTTIARAICRVLPIDAGEIRYRGSRISGKLSRKTEKELAGEIQLVFQDPMSSLNERATVGYIVAEGLYAGRKLPRREIEKRAERILAETGLQPQDTAGFPYEFSGGERQRIGIARALITEPGLLIADEPVSSLDAPIRIQVLDLMKKMVRERRMSCLLITHDLAAARRYCDRIAVLRNGELVEAAPAEELFRKPRHPYTRSLVEAAADQANQAEQTQASAEPSCSE